MDYQMLKKFGNESSLLYTV